MIDLFNLMQSVEGVLPVSIHESIAYQNISVMNISGDDIKNQPPPPK